MTELNQLHVAGRDLVKELVFMETLNGTDLPLVGDDPIAPSCLVHRETRSLELCRCVAYGIKRIIVADNVDRDPEDAIRESMRTDTVPNLSRLVGIV